MKRNTNVFNRVSERIEKAINEAMNVDFSRGTMSDDDNSVKTGTMSRGGWKPSVKQNIKTHNFGEDKIQRELNNSHGPKYGNTMWDPNTQHVELEWDDDMEHDAFDFSNPDNNTSRSRVHTYSDTMNSIVNYPIGNMPSDEEIAAAAERYGTPENDAFVKNKVNSIFRANSRATKCILQTAHIVKNRGKDVPAVTPDNDIELLSCVLLPTEKTKEEVLAHPTLDVWDLQKGEPRKITLDSLIYMHIQRETQKTITDERGNILDNVAGTCFWQPAHTTGAKPSSRQRSGKYSQYAYGTKTDPDRVDPVDRHEVGFKRALDDENPELGFRNGFTRH